MTPPNYFDCMRLLRRGCRRQRGSATMESCSASPSASRRPAPLVSGPGVSRSPGVLKVPRRSVRSADASSRSVPSASRAVGQMAIMVTADAAAPHEHEPSVPSGAQKKAPSAKPRASRRSPWPAAPADCWTTRGSVGGSRSTRARARTATGSHANSRPEAPHPWAARAERRTDPYPLSGASLRRRRPGGAHRMSGKPVEAVQARRARVLQLRAMGASLSAIAKAVGADNPKYGRAAAAMDLRRALASERQFRDAETPQLRLVLDHERLDA